MWGKHETIPHPFVRTKLCTPTPEVLPDNLVYTKGQAYVQRWTSQNTIELDRWVGSTGQRKDTVDAAELDAVRALGLKETRYQELKVFWAAHYSCAQTAREFRGQRGYGQRTLEKYWAAFNKLNPSPTISEGERAQ